MFFPMVSRPWNTTTTQLFSFIHKKWPLASDLQKLVLQSASSCSTLQLLLIYGQKILKMSVKKSFFVNLLY